MTFLRMLWLAAGMVAAQPASAFDWRELWETPTQRAGRLLANGEYRHLAEDAPDATWEGIARYQAGDIDAAADAFDRALTDPSPPVGSSSTTLLYNQATVAARQGRYADAVAGFDAVLDADPTHAAALHNRTIAARLQALEDAAQAPQAGQPSTGEDGQNAGGGQGSAASPADSASAEGQDTGEAAGEASASQSGTDGQRSSEPGAADPAAEARRPSEEAGDDTDGDGEGDAPVAAEGAGKAAAGSTTSDGAPDLAEGESTPLSEAQRVEEDTEAAAALAAEADAAGTGEEAADGDRAAGTDAPVSVTPRPWSEREQATEQWLRRIPDDPAGLLRRKLQQSHLNDYPEVRGSAERW